MTTRSFAVVQVTSGPPDAVIGVDFGGDQGYRQFTLAGQFAKISPKIGDNVLIDMDGVPGKSSPFVVSYQTTGRVPADPGVTVTIANAGPTGDGWEAINAIYYNPGVKAFWLVRNTPAPPSTTGSQIVRPVGSRTWDPSNGWRSDDTKVRQGSFGSGGNKGLWFYGSAFGFLAGRTGVAATLTVTRDARGGTPWSPKPLYVCTHAYATEPTTEPVVSATVIGGSAGVNDTITFPLPASMVAAFVAGTAVGVGLYADSTSDYLICQGSDQSTSGVLAFSWTG